MKAGCLECVREVSVFFSFVPPNYLECSAVENEPKSQSRSKQGQSLCYCHLGVLNESILAGLVTFLLLALGCCGRVVPNRNGHHVVGRLNFPKRVVVNKAGHYALRCVGCREPVVLNGIGRFCYAATISRTCSGCT